jgi:hypothetical protein
MARSHDIYALASAALSNDKEKVLSACKIIAAHEKQGS